MNKNIITPNLLEAEGNYVDMQETLYTQKKVFNVIATITIITFIAFVAMLLWKGADINMGTLTTILFYSAVPICWLQFRKIEHTKKILLHQLSKI